MWFGVGAEAKDSGTVKIISISCDSIPAKVQEGRLSRRSLLFSKRFCDSGLSLSFTPNLNFAHDFFTGSAKNP